MDLGETLRVAAWSSENKWGRGHCVGCHHRLPASLLHGPIQYPTQWSLWLSFLTSRAPSQMLKAQMLKSPFSETAMPSSGRCPWPDPQSPEL